MTVLEKLKNYNGRTINAIPFRDKDVVNKAVAGKLIEVLDDGFEIEPTNILAIERIFVATEAGLFIKVFKENEDIFKK